MAQKLININAFSLPESWITLIRTILNNGRDFVIDSGSYAGHIRKELDFVTVHIEKPSHSPIVPTSAMLPQNCKFPPPCDIDYIDNEYVPRYLMSDTKTKNETYTYGTRMMEQWSNIIKMYKEGGHRTNQACIEIAMPSDIMLSDPPCLRLIDTRIQDNKLHFYIYFRSWDAWSGFPANMAGLQRIKEIMAYEIGIEDGELIACSKGLHLYDIYFEVAQQLKV